MNLSDFIQPPVIVFQSGFHTNGSHIHLKIQPPFRFFLLLQRGLYGLAEIGFDFNFHRAILGICF